MPYKKLSSEELPKVYDDDDDDTTHRRKTIKEEHKRFVSWKIGICIAESLFDCLLIYYAISVRDDTHANAYWDKATWLIYCTWFSLILYAFKIVMSFREAYGNDDDRTRRLFDALLLLSLWIDVLKCCLNMLFVAEHKNMASLLKAVFVIFVKFFKRIVSAMHHFRGCSMCVVGIYVIGIIVEVWFAGLVIYKYFGRSSK